MPINPEVYGKEVKGSFDTLTNPAPKQAPRKPEAKKRGKVARLPSADWYLPLSVVLGYERGVTIRPATPGILERSAAKIAQHPVIPTRDGWVAGDASAHLETLITSAPRATLKRIRRGMRRDDTPVTESCRRAWHVLIDRLMTDRHRQLKSS